MDKPIEIYYSPNYKITYSDLDGFFSLWKWNEQNQVWGFVDNQSARTFGDNWINDLILNGKVAVGEVS